jgi:adenylate cyclase
VVLSLVLAIALGVALVVIVVLACRLSRARRDLAAARERMRGRRAQRPPRAVRVAGRAVRNVVDGAAHVRRYGVSDFLMSSIQEFTGWTNEDRAEIAIAATPDGIVTIFFSDIQDSTEINERLGDAPWMRLLTEHDRLVRAKVGQCGGHVVKTQGDGFMVVFGEPVEGIRAALAIQAALARGGGHRLRQTPVRVRIGMHVGVVTSRDGDYFGRNVAMAARVAAHADGGQILVTDDIRNTLADTEEVELVRADEVELKGLVGRHQLWLVQPRNDLARIAGRPSD